MSDMYEIVMNGGVYVNLRGSGLGAEDAIEIAKALMHPNTMVENLILGSRYGEEYDEDGFDLESNYIQAEGAIAIANALKLNSTLQVLWKVLSDDRVGVVDSAKEIFEAWNKTKRISSKLQTLYLRGHRIGDEGVTALGEALKINSTLQTLNLEYNRIGEEGATALGKALEINSTLQTLNLDDNTIGVEGARALSEALQFNSTLQTLNLDNNKIGVEGATALGKALEINSILQTLNLVNNNIGDEGATALGEALKINSTLHTLKLYRNRIGDEGAAVFEAQTRGRVSF